MRPLCDHITSYSFVVARRRLPGLNVVFPLVGLSISESSGVREGVVEVYMGSC